MNYLTRGSFGIFKLQKCEMDFTVGHNRDFKKLFTLLLVLVLPINFNDIWLSEYIIIIF